VTRAPPRSGPPARPWPRRERRPDDPAWDSLSVLVGLDSGHAAPNPRQPAAPRARAARLAMARHGRALPALPRHTPSLSPGQPRWCGGARRQAHALPGLPWHRHRPHAARTVIVGPTDDDLRHSAPASARPSNVPPALVAARRRGPTGSNEDPSKGSTTLVPPVRWQCDVDAARPPRRLRTCFQSRLRSPII
jgi:hypothetical protein